MSIARQRSARHSSARSGALFAPWPMMIQVMMESCGSTSLTSYCPSILTFGARRRCGPWHNWGAMMRTMADDERDEEGQLELVMQQGLEGVHDALAQQQAAEEESEPARPLEHLVSRSGVVLY